jgi:hypothetical protein
MGIVVLVLGLSFRRIVKLSFHHNSLPILRMCGAIPPLPMGLHGMVFNIDQNKSYISEIWDGPPTAISGACKQNFFFGPHSKEEPARKRRRHRRTQDGLRPHVPSPRQTTTYLHTVLLIGESMHHRRAPVICTSPPPPHPWTLDLRSLQTTSYGTLCFVVMLVVFETSVTVYRTTQRHMFMLINQLEHLLNYHTSYPSA